MQGQLNEENGVVTDRHVRFQVLTPSLIRLEYSSSGEFEDRPTFFAVERDFAVPEFEARVSDGWIEIETNSVTVRYERGSGSFDQDNTVVELAEGSSQRTRSPKWKQRVCRTNDATVSGSVAPADEQQGYSGAGYVTRFGDGKAEWHIDSPPTEDEYTITIRYSIQDDPAETGERSLELRTDDEMLRRIEFPRVAGWGKLQMDIPLEETIDTLTLTGSGDEYSSVCVDYLLISGIGASPPDPELNNLGGWYRDLDGQGGPVDLFDGLLC